MDLPPDFQLQYTSQWQWLSSCPDEEARDWHLSVNNNYNGRPGQQRRILTKDQAIAIYAQRKSAKASSVAANFHINTKTVRDIWNRRTWAEETQHLWEEGEQPVIRSKKRLIRFARGSSTSSGALSAHETEDRSCTSSSTSSVSPCDCSWIEHDEELLADSVDAHDGCSEAWEWECGIAPLAGIDDDPFKDDVHSL
mmetsp:Transcript_63357/g.169410  ORF Transcript_63357/g.169410 Transcript_63357/m.169410 type:complete len:196 (+) Transcript_63357:205-792(+)|eukprot:CAMPEP_0113704506 /NCGR_PEP_ID=MMETSP0038_2-20120614/26559_1 /TAXON_ID=2898 /ORGANISM="Cryptomonas paramecium" /LENGTH=195 /DNA_ID=CAMNT_0000629299 /DNA_START=188 /DNA_END=775 /DNA_ORIENTATION=+ /assembly_acc=CAM_ASM_000170